MELKTMKYEKEFSIDLVTFDSFYDFIKEIKNNHKNEQLIGYRTERNVQESKVKVIVTFDKDENENSLQEQQDR